MFFYNNVHTYQNYELHIFNKSDDVLDEECLLPLHDDLVSFSNRTKNLELNLSQGLHPMTLWMALNCHHARKLSY